MKKIFLLFLALVAVSSALFAQADQKLISKAEKGDADAMVMLAHYYELGAGVPKDSLTAFNWYQKAAEKGNCEAWIRISVYHLIGAIVPKDTARYLAIRQEWAAKEAPEALTAMSLTYLRGTHIAPDTARSLQYLDKAVQKGEARAYTLMGDMYYWKELNYPKDDKKALGYWNKVLKSNTVYSELAAFRLACYYMWQAKPDYKKAWKYVAMGTQKSDPDCLALAAYMRFMGYGVDKDERTALREISRVAHRYENEGFVQSYAGYMYYLAKDPLLQNADSARYFWGKGAAIGSQECRYRLSVLVSETDETTAIAMLDTILEERDGNAYKGEACFFTARIMAMNDSTNEYRFVDYVKRGAEQYGDRDCMLWLASIYSYDAADNPLEFNLDKTEQWYKTAAEDNNSQGLEALGEFYESTENWNAALNVYQRMVDAGDFDGYFYLARCLSNAGADTKKQLDYIKTGDKKGSKLCSQVLGNLYKEGYVDGKENFKKAAECYERSGTDVSLYNLAMLYFNGQVGSGSEKDFAKALDCLKRSHEMGNDDASIALAYIYESGAIIGEENIDRTQSLAIYRALAQKNVAFGYYKVGQYYEMGEGGLQVDSVLSVENLRRAADLGHGGAMCYLGDYHRIGQFLPRDSVKAFEYYRMADDAGSEVGTYYVGRSFLEGCGVQVDTAAAIPYLRRAANEGVGKAAYLMGSFFMQGKGGLTPDADSAFIYYYRGHENGYSEASYQVALRLLQEEYFQDAFNTAVVAAQRGSVDGVVLTALMLQEGLGTEADPVEAYRLFEVAAQKGDDSRGYYQMGIARLQGNGCKEDEILGKMYLDTAAAMGNTQAMYILGICYLQGYGCEPDSALYIKWFSQAAEAGNVRAQNMMGDIYEDAEDYENAVRYYQMAVDAGDNDGLCNMGYCYEKGQGVVLSFKKAVQFYEQAVNQGSVRGCKLLANCYLEGTGVEKDANKALELYMMAANAGDEQAMYLIGSLYEEGDEGIKKDLKEAKKWYKKSAAAGYEPAQAALNRL